MAIAFDNAVSTSSAAAASTLETASFTIAANTFLTVGVLTGSGAPATPTAVKFGGSGGTSLSQIGTTQNVDGSFVQISAWGLFFAGGGSGTIHVTWAASHDERGVGGASYTGVDSATSTRTTAQANAVNNGPATVNATTVANDWVVDVVGTVDFGGAAPGITVGANQTARVEIDSIGGFEALGLSDETATGTSTTMSWTLGGVTDAWGIIAIPLIPAAAGGDPEGGLIGGKLLGGGLLLGGVLVR